MATKAICTIGLERSATILKDDINYTAVGTDTTSPTIADVKLGAETARKLPAKVITQGKMFQIRTNFLNANLPAVAKEWGWFMDGTEAADSGNLLAHILNHFEKGVYDLMLILEVRMTEA